MIHRNALDFFQQESASGVLLLIAAIAALALINSPLAPLYHTFFELPIQIRVGHFDLNKPLLLWINDGLMAIFFLLVGMELKREFMDGELSSPAKAMLPVLCAVGGMAVPALIYVAVNRGDPVALRGWAVPTATDIAFAVSVLALFGSRVPAGLKTFLLLLAIVDDLGAILIIALFYSAELSGFALVAALGMVSVLALLNRAGVQTIAPYVLAGVLLWVAVLKSGAHATLAGVVLAMFVPLRGDGPGQDGPLRRLESDLHPAVAFGILPLFAFANAGVSFAGMSPDSLFAPVPLGIALGLLVGKPAGVMLCAAAAVAVRVCRLPEGVTWGQLMGVALLCGIGFTMSLFIGSLAFESRGPQLAIDVRLGILCGSLLSGIGGYWVLRVALRGGRALPA
jgi:NhaA family Na+:H+ antiporter